MNDDDIMQATRLAVRNPAAFFKTGIQYIESRLNGYTIPDPLSPMIQQLEISSAQACAHIEESMAADRKAYPVLARTLRDLYANASDYDMINRFSQPGKVSLHVMFPKEELIGRMVNVAGSQLRKVVIPRNTEIIIDNQTTLLLHHPIEIRQPIHKGVVNTNAPLLVVYNTELKNPLHTLDDNVVEWYITRSPQGREFLDVTIEMYQLDRSVIKTSLAGGTHYFNQPYRDYFHAARVFYGSDDGGWNECKTTYSEYVYSPRTPTVIITVEESVVNFRIPPVYIQNGRIPDGSSIRFDIYTTVGPVDNDLSTLTGNAFKMNMTEDIDDPALEPYSAPLRSLEFSVYSTSTLTGGSKGLTFNEMLSMIINNSSIIDLPITPAQIQSRLAIMGFDVIKHRDDLTNRIYLATKTLTADPRSSFMGAPASGMLTLTTTLDDIVDYPGVWDNGNRVTVSPETLFTLQGGGLEPVASESYPDKQTSMAETLVNLVNSNRYVYTPFHYVLDMNNKNFDLRAYQLGNPKHTTREFLHENETTQLEISTTGFDITRTDTGYLLTITAQVGNNWQALKASQRFAQIGFIPYGEQNRAYLNGEYKGRVSMNNVVLDTWEFPIRCTFDLDEHHNLIVDNFAIFTSVPRTLPLPLDSVFSLVYSVTDYTVEGLTGSDVDGLLGRALLPLDVYGVTSEYVGIKLGKELTALWTNRRSVAGAKAYKTYPIDVMAVWEKDEYEIDPITGVRTFTIDQNGKVEFNKLHSKGDPVLVDGVQKIKYPAGTVMVDDNTGLPIPSGQRPITRLVDLFVVDGVYFYANDTTARQDAGYINDRIVNAYIPDLETLSDRTLENTAIYLYPKKTLGTIPVLIDDAVEVTIEAELDFQFLFYATETGYRDLDFRKMIESVAESAVGSVLKNRTVSTSAITAKINQNSDDRLSGFVVSMFSKGKSLSTFTTKDDGYRATVRRVAALNEDGKIKVKEAIQHEWDLHLPEA